MLLLYLITTYTLFVSILEINQISYLVKQVSTPNFADWAYKVLKDGSETF